MPPQLLFDIAGIDLNRVTFDQEAIRKVNPHRGDMEQLNAIVHTDPPNGRIIGYKEVRDDEFWVAGHIPGRPVLPGVLMLECAAQLASFYTHMFDGWKGFIGFGGADEVKFRQQVVPGARLYVLGQKLSERHRRIQCRVHGMVNGSRVFEALVTGVLI
jgi:3-hydroxyacyl-[acyl-carrier-protein] dehydratase